MAEVEVTRDSEATSGVARSGAFSLVGAVISSAMGFAFVFVIARILDADGAGIVLQTVAAFSIALGFARAGLDTTAVWLLPRVARDDVNHLRGAVGGILLPSLALSVGAGIVLSFLAGPIGGSEPALEQSIRTAAFFLPLATFTMVGLAATRGLGGVRPFVLIGSIGVPTSRALIAVLAGLLTTSAFVVSWTTFTPYVVAAAVTIVVLTKNVRRRESRHQVRGQLIPPAALRRTIWTYSIPRSISTVLEQSMQWLDILFVGVLAGPQAAGIYGAASRFVAAGFIMSTALRIVVAPQYSRSLSVDDVDATQALYQTTTKWIVVLSVPFYVLLAAFGGTLLSVLGEEFRGGANALTIMSVGLIATLLTGNVDTVLLMSGRSSLAAQTKAAAVVVFIVALLVLVPAYGINGAALAFTISMVVDAVLAAFFVQSRVGVRVGGAGLYVALVLPIVTVGVPAVAARLLLGDSLLGLAGGGTLGLCVFLIAAGLMRHQLELTEILGLFRRGKSGNEESV